MSTRILGLGTANPQHRMSQDEALAMFADIVCEDEKQKRLARVLFRKSEVKNRHTVVPHKVAYNWCQATEPLQATASVGSATANAFGPEDHNLIRSAEDLAIPSESMPMVEGGQSQGPTTHERMLLYQRFASSLAIDAAQRALEAADCTADSITHLVTVTCTGFDAPGVDIELINRLGLPSTTQRINVGFMGCHGAINGLRTAQAVAESNPQARVLLVAVELCSLHYRFQWNSEGIVGNALFADGAASVVVESTSARVPAQSALGAWQVLATGSLVLPDSKEAMSWRVGDHGFEMMLTSEVGDRIEAGLGDWLDAWLDQQRLGREDIALWGVHPGGPRILSAVQSSLALPADALAVSRYVLENYGNMSSPTVLFILQEFMRRKKTEGRGIASGEENEPVESPQHCLLLAFGPGLVAELALIRTA